MDSTQIYIDDANTIWRDYVTRVETDTKFMSLTSEERLEFFQKKYSGFQVMFPVVVRYMVIFGQFSPSAFARHAKKIKDKPFRTEDDYCRQQADYVKYLFMDLSPAHDSKEAKMIWQQTYNKLKEEIESFKDTKKRESETLKANEVINSRERRKELIDAIMVNTKMA